MVVGEARGCVKRETAQDMGNARCGAGRCRYGPPYGPATTRRRGRIVTLAMKYTAILSVTDRFGAARRYAAIMTRFTNRELPVSKFFRRGLAAALPVAALLAAAPAFAQNDAAAGNADLAAKMGGDSVTVGVAGAFVPDYEGSDHYRFTPAPAIIGQFKGFNFSVIGNRAAVDLIPNRPGQTIDLQLGPIAVLNFDRGTRKNIDDVQVRNLGKIDNAIELGGYIGIGKTGVITSPYDKISVSVSYRHDVSNVHDSGIWQPSINYLTPLSRKAAVGFAASASHVESGYAHTYFSITPGQSLSSGLPVYNARAGWKNYQLGGYFAYSLTGDLLHGVKLIAGGAYSRLLGSYSYSPIVRINGKPNQWLGAVGVAYTF